MNTISIDRLSKRFGSTRALESLTVEIAPGSVYALIGPNGAGKTTAFRILINALPPSSGSATVLGIDSRRLQGTDYTRIGYVSENQHMPDWMSVGYFLTYLEPFYPSWDPAFAERLLRRFDIPRNRKLRHLSRGMRIKVSLISSLVYHPRLLILDEPFTGLDATIRDDLVECVVGNGAESTTLISSHDLAEVESCATHIGYLNNGRLIFSEQMAGLKGRFRMMEVVGAALTNPPSDWPKRWLLSNHKASSIRFVETEFDDENTLREIDRLFGPECHVSSSAMSLREIFVTLGRQLEDRSTEFGQ